MCIRDRDNKDAIITYITRESYSKTFTQRAREYVDRFSKEVETAIAAGLLLNLSKDKLLSSIRQSVKTPLLNEHVQRAISKGYPVISRLGVQESFGVGRTVSSVSYTHLDVYKRQCLGNEPSLLRLTIDVLSPLSFIT